MTKCISFNCVAHFQVHTRQVRIISWNGDLNGLDFISKQIRVFFIASEIESDLPLEQFQL